MKILPGWQSTQCAFSSPGDARRSDGGPYTVIYDGNCRVCERVVTLLAKWDRGHDLEIIPSQTPEVRARFPWIPARAFAESVQVVRNSDGKTWQDAGALEELLSVLPRGRLMSWLFSVPFVRPLADKSYRWFARNRYKLGCRLHVRSLAFFAALAGSVACASACTSVPRASGAHLVRGLATADSLIDAAVGKLMPGAVFVVAKNGVVLTERAFGYAELNDYDLRRLANPRPMRTSTRFDLASVTKVMGTTLAAMVLNDRGLIDLDAPVHRYLPDFRGPRLDSITVRHLLTHSSGLVQWQPLYYSAANKAKTYAAIRDMPLGWGVGDARHYSDLGFMLLGYIVEHVSGEGLDVFLASNLYGPLGLGGTGFNPKARGFTDFAATEQGNGYERHMVYDSTFGYRYRGDPASWDGWRRYVLSGEVDDGNAWYGNGGVAGHAGLFSTAGDLRVLLDLLNSRGMHRGRRVISPEVVDRFLTLDRYRNYLGWRLPPAMPPGSFDHTGFTGTWVLGVPSHGLSVVLLTNRQNLGTDARGYFPDLAPLQSAVASAIVNGAMADTPTGFPP